MRYEENKTFPYPVLRVGSEDYVDGAFQATVKYTLSEDAQALRVDATFRTSEPAIIGLVREKKAKYAMLLESRETYFRDLITSSDSSVDRTYQGGLISGPVTLLPYIVATRRVPGFKSDLFNPEYQDRTFDLEPGDVLALDQPREFYVGQEVFAHIGTVFELVEEDGIATGEIRLGLESEKVQIRVSPEQKESLDAARGQKDARPVLLASVYLPVLMQVLSSMARGAEEFEERKWFRSILSKCERAGVELSDETDLLKAAQLLLDFPMRSLNQVHFGGD